MSSENCEPACGDCKPIHRTNSGKVIVYDPATQELKRQRLEDLDGERFTNDGGSDHNRVLIFRAGQKIKYQYRCRAPNMGSRTRIYEDQNSQSFLLASVKLSNLGWQASWQRLRGRCNDVYTIETHDSSNGIIQV